MPRCRNCKDKFEPVRFNAKYCLKDECIRAFVAETKEKAWKQTKTRMKNDLKTLSDWLKETQVVFNKYIRLRDQDKLCISCDKPIRKGNCDAGHLWSSGGHSNLRFNEYNVNAQCSRPCNKDKSGDINNYRIGFIKRYGQEKLEELDSLAHLEKKFTIDELKMLITEYKKKCNEFK